MAIVAAIWPPVGRLWLGFSWREIKVAFFVTFAIDAVKRFLLPWLESEEKAARESRARKTALRQRENDAAR